eukprot:CAMPEP_0204905050 /NCGR_PEP_ID=MMETSP1397-20131031/5213_1 /ASSEMBLY_ACC=CAM_ASM_000891 /TAXON_ID=49980 /ORGANISM="Climacostomum Climacostomum virens, Strain Stock W-24" /LENGTH=104 /DNA_ID=CAMNT_0052073903 /DNA_START=172 /DNA_END=489 /DNA_ORIENTATION=+
MSYRFHKAVSLCYVPKSLQCSRKEVHGEFLSSLRVFDVYGHGCKDGANHTGDRPHAFKDSIGVAKADPSIEVEESDEETRPRYGNNELFQGFLWVSQQLLPPKD